MKMSAKALIANALECRSNAGPFMVGGHPELAQPWITSAIMDSLLALAMLERSGQHGAWKRHNAFREALEKLMARLPDAGTVDVLVDVVPDAAPLGKPQPVPYTQARVHWLADRLLDSLWEPGVALEASDTLRRLAPFMAADAVAPDATHGTDTTLQPHAYVQALDHLCMECGRGQDAAIHSTPQTGPVRTDADTTAPQGIAARDTSGRRSQFEAPPNQPEEAMPPDPPKRTRVYCGGDRCTHLWNLPCDNPTHTPPTQPEAT